MVWYCSVCLFVCYEPALAVTIINGQASCRDHMRLFTGGAHTQALNMAVAQDDVDLRAARLPECKHI